MYTITIVAGARPNFIKIAPIINAIKKSNSNINYRLVHTGQHYDKNMSDSFFEQLNISKPDINLECSGGTQAELTASLMLAFEKDLIENPTDLVLVVGDVTSTMACAIVTKKLNTKLAHVEGGIRSYDLTMPEEINRMVTDSISDYFFTTSEKANTNLLQVGIDDGRIFFVGNTMIDTLLAHRKVFVQPKLWTNLDLKKKSYIMLTMHRPANVDAEHKLKAMIDEIMLRTRDFQVIFPAHPRTSKMLSNLNISHERLHIIKPLSYLEFNYLVEHSKAVITDSGGITEEASVLNVPCLTLRDNTERPETVSLGTNVLVGTNPKSLKTHLDVLFKDQWKKGQTIPLWDGKAAERIVNVIIEKLKVKN